MITRRRWTGLQWDDKDDRNLKYTAIDDVTYLLSKLQISIGIKVCQGAMKRTRELIALWNILAITRCDMIEGTRRGFRLDA